MTRVPTPVWFASHQVACSCYTPMRNPSSNFGRAAFVFGHYSLRVTGGVPGQNLSRTFSRTCNPRSMWLPAPTDSQTIPRQTTNLEPLPGNITAICTPPLDRPASLGFHRPQSNRSVRTPVLRARTNIDEALRPWCFLDGRTGLRYQRTRACSLGGSTFLIPAAKQRPIAKTASPNSLKSRCIGTDSQPSTSASVQTEVGRY